jgi:GR25 family glycosyltransferase involved in LPS biosynthesis
MRSPVTDYLFPISNPMPSSTIEGIDAIYLINLAKRKDKRERVSSHLANHGLSFCLVEGFDGWEHLSDEEIKRMSGPYPILLNKGQVGCFISHLSCVQDAYQKGYNRIWILEDDVIIHKDPKTVSVHLEELYRLKPDWDLLYTDSDVLIQRAHFLPISIDIPHTPDQLPPIRPDEPYDYPLSYWLERPPPLFPKCATVGDCTPISSLKRESPLSCTISRPATSTRQSIVIST